jgi:pilus assembly protein TadC
MAFGWSFPKLMVLISVTFILFGVPLMAFLLALRERKRRKRSGDE